MSSRMTRPLWNETSENNFYPKSVEIDGREDIWSIAFLADGRHVVSGGEEGKIRCWRVEDGEEMGLPMDAGSAVGNLAVSQDGKWIVSGTTSGQVAVWDAESHSKVSQFAAHPSWVRVVDVSPDATRIATGSKDKTACIWSLSAGQRLLGPLRHNSSVGAVKFSPDGHLLATATWWRESVRVYDTQNRSLLIDVPIKVNSALNQSLAWANDSKRLFALASDGHVTYLNVFTGATLSQWRIHNDKQARCITLAPNGTFIAASAESSYSLWDITTHQQVGAVIEHTPIVASMAISADYNIVTGGGKKIRLRNIYDLIPLTYYKNIFLERAKWDVSAKGGCLETACESAHTRDRDSNEKIAILEKPPQDLRDDLRVKEESSNSKIMHLEQMVQQLHDELTESKRKADGLIQIIRVHEQKHQCEALYAGGHIVDAAASLLELTDTISEDAKANELIMNWLTEFTCRCVSTLENTGNEASNALKHSKAITAYSAALSLSQNTSSNLLMKWASTMLICGTATEALDTAAKFKCPRFVVYRVICDVLERDDRLTEGTECFRQMQDELGVDTDINGERARWESDFRRRCREKLGRLVNVAMDLQNYSDADGHLSSMLLLDPVDRVDILMKRSAARASMSSWEEALGDADEVLLAPHIVLDSTRRQSAQIIKLEPSSHQGYERRHAVLHGAKRYAEAAEAFHTMLSKLEESPHEDIRGRRRLYVDATPTIRRIVEQTIRHMPRVLIDTTTGCLYDKRRQASAFEELSVYSELISSMTTELDHARIYREVKKFYRYVMLSHRWEHDEPLLQKVESVTSVHNLEPSPANIKLQTFCSLVNSLGFRWAWSDTSCVDKLNNVILQESLVAMFTWYRGSSLTIVYLRGVSSKSQLRGDLRRSVWNTRAWTYQEYVAAETIQFYTEDWKPYLSLTLPNHKESPIIISEMHQATGVSAQVMAVLRPGLDKVREKLFLASMRQTTLVEDAAYSLFGIFHVAIPAIYGEGNRAVGRLLEHILTGSGDVAILAWTGIAGGYNSCLPSDLTVYNQLVPPHVPATIETAEMNSTVAALRSSLADLSLAVQLHNRLNELPSPSLASSRLRLPGIVFPLTELVRTSDPDPVTNISVYLATSSTLGKIEIKTRDDLTMSSNLCLVHPWIRVLLDQEFLAGAAALDSTTQALRLVVRLGQPFGALLFEPVSRVEYRRVSADAFVVAQVQEPVELMELMNGIRTIEVR